MAYYTKVLQPDEQVRYIGRLHWTMYRHAILLFVLAIVVAGLSFYLDDDRRWLPLAGAALLLLIAVMSFISTWLHRIGVEIVVTDRRIINKRGWIARQTEEMNISKVETVDVAQSIMGRMLDYGTVTAKGTGHSIEFFGRIAEPLQLRNAIIVG